MYENIDYVDLKCEVNEALNGISSHDLDSIKNSLAALNVLPSEIKEITNKKIDEINKSKTLIGSIVVLQAHLNKLLKSCDKIRDYQNKKYELTKWIREMDDEKTSHIRKKNRLKNELQKIKNELDAMLNKKI